MALSPGLGARLCPQTVGRAGLSVSVDSSPFYRPRDEAQTSIPPPTMEPPP